MSASMICTAISLEVNKFLIFVATLYWEMVINLVTGKLNNVKPFSNGFNKFLDVTTYTNDGIKHGAIFCFLIFGTLKVLPWSMNCLNSGWQLITGFLVSSAGISPQMLATVMVGFSCCFLCKALLWKVSENLDLNESASFLLGRTKTVSPELFLTYFWLMRIPHL